MLPRRKAATGRLSSTRGEDRRQIRIRLTEHARSLEERYQEVSDKMNRLFYRGFTEEEILRFDSMLGHILKNLEAEEKRYDTKESRTAENGNPDNQNPCQ